MVDSAGENGISDANIYICVVNTKTHAVTLKLTTWSILSQQLSPNLSLRGTRVKEVTFYFTTIDVKYADCQWVHFVQAIREQRIVFVVCLAE